MSRYGATEGEQDEFQIVQLSDTERGVEAKIAPSLGNSATGLALNGREFLWRPDRSLTDLLELRTLFGIPFLAPWANRLSQESYWVEGASYKLNRDLGNLRMDHYAQPIHGLLLFQPWQVDEIKADAGGAEVKSSLRFSSYPKLSAQFPFAHTLEMRHILKDGRLHIRTRIVSECAQRFPVSIGFHPYFTLPGSNRDEWKLHLAGRRHHELTTKSIPTGVVVPVEPLHVDVKDVELDDVYSDLERDSDGIAHFRIESNSAHLAVGFGPKFGVSVVYAPRTGNFVCIEPMTAITDALNLAHTGLYNELQMIEPGEAWEEEFCVEPGVREPSSV